VLTPPFPARLEAAVALSPFARVARDKLERLFARGEMIRVPAHYHARRPNDPPRLCLVTDGLVRVFFTAADGRQMTVRYTRAGDLLGPLRLLPFDASLEAQTLTESEGWVAPIDDALRAEIFADPEFARIVAAEATQRVAELVDELHVAGFGSVRRRVARHLLDLAEAHGPDLIARVSQRQIAQAAGSVREVVARVVRELKAEGVVAVVAEGIVIRDARRLYEGN
jgi:CRP/FNR family cyclic AMP-dependent transcriptional regulator